MICASSQLSLFLLPKYQLELSTLECNPFTQLRLPLPILNTRKKQCSWCVKASMITDFKVPTTYVVDSIEEQVYILPDTGGGGGESNGSDGNDNYEVEESKKKTGMSISQKLTIGYAVLVGAGGIMGYLKSGSQKSLIAGGLTASLLYGVYTFLPTDPVIASSLGFGLSGSLLGVMGSRFLESGKIFPAGIVALLSLVMSVGYLHGILRGLH